MTMEREIARLNWVDFREAARNIGGAIMPIGTVEAHGSANLGTDITIPEYLARRIADELDLLIAPTVNYGITRTLLPYPGSLAVSPEAFERYVYEAAESLIKTGFEWILFLNGHGGHNDELASVARRLWKETGGRSIVLHWWEFCDPVTREVFGEPGGHSGLDETYMVMAADPELVSGENYDPSMEYLVREGVYPYPKPGTVLLYEEGKGSPRFDPEDARRYADAVTEEIVGYLGKVLDSWERDFS